ncbi:hypothetical protein EDB81DRAFT_644289, partial [Dactylonectria macrodidyma]
GLVVNAATGAAFLYLKGHASSLLQNGLRLVLVTFLVTSALWAQTDFITTLISLNSSTGCQVTIVFATIFDQLARTSLQQAIIWAVDHHARVSKAESLITQGAIFLRLILGAVFVGLQRPQLDIICITTTSNMPFGVALLGADLAFTAAILGRAISFGLIKDMQEGTATSSRSRAALLTIVGLLIWTGTSAPLMLGIRSPNVMTRTAIPGTGLSILIGILTLSKEEPDNLSDAATLRDTHPTRHLQSRDISTSDSTLPPSRYEELKGDALASFRAASQLQNSHLRTGSAGTVTKLPVISRPNVGQAATGIGGVPVQGQFFPPLRAQTMPVSMETREPSNRPGVLTRKGTKLTISNPILTEDSEQRVMEKIPTIDLATAVENEKQRAKAIQMVEPPASFTSREESTATTSATMLSPGVEELRRRSPRQTSDPLPNAPLPPPFPAPFPPSAVNYSFPVDSQNPVYSNPAAVQRAVDSAKEKQSIKSPGRTASMVHRPRPIPRLPSIDRAIFPAEGSPNMHEHKRSLSNGPSRTKTLMIMTWDEKMDMFYPESGSGRSSIVGNMRRRSRSVPDVPTMPMVLSESKRDTASPHTSIANRGPRSNAPNSPTYQAPSRNVADRRSSPILPAEDLSMFSPYSEARSIVDDASTNWGSIHSPGTFVNVQQARAVDVPAVPKLPQDGAGLAAGSSSVNHGVDPTPKNVPAKETQAIAETEQGWHRRVGEECPTFSDRGQIPRQRRIPPPAPLLLRRTNMVPMAIQAEPSPLESPEHALAMIQEQLRKLDDQDRGSASSGQRDRMTLLANLETELGQQEHQWQGLRGTLMVRDSQSTLGGTPKLDSLHMSVRRSFATPLTEDVLQPASLTKQVSRQLLSEQPVFPSSKNPPRGIDGAGSEYDREPRVVHTHPGKTLWCPISSNTAASGASLWTPATKPVVRETVPDQITTDVVRRRLDKGLEPLTIESTSLWEKSMSERRFSQHGLWRSTTRPPAKEEQQVHRQTAQRPPRKSKRITMLPDILESPKPLDRRGTMGIFQFPWGEMSDTPSVPARPLTMMAMAGTMTTGQGREQPGADNWNAAGSKSFFEDYEAEEDGDSDYGSFSESDDEDDDDGFDETVLWEIASLLKPSQERSGNSVLSPTRGTPHQGPQRGEDGATDKQADGAEFVRRNDPEAMRFITTNFTSSETKSPSTPVRALTGTAKLRAPPMTAGTARDESTPRAASASPRSDGPHATATPMDKPMETDQGPGRFYGFLHGFLQGREKPVPARPLPPRVLLPSADKSANANEDVSIQTAPSAGSAILSKSSLSSNSQSNSQLSPLSAVSTQNLVPQQQSLLRNANYLSLAGPMAMLWSPPSAPILRPSKGLSQPDTAIWNSYLPIENAARVQARKAELPSLQSTSLWAQPPSKKAAGPSLDGLWSPVFPQDLSVAPPAMWALPPVIEPVSYGLEQPDAELWSKYLPGHDESPRVKPREAQPATITSQAMWTKPSAGAMVAHSAGPLWTAPKSSSSTPTEAVSFGLWAPAPAATEVKEPVGLFSLSHQRSDFRTSSLSPAALDMARKPRAPEQPFSDFGFTHLWNQAPLWDAAATAAAVKMQREIDELVLEGLFSLNHRRTNFRTTSEAPAALDTKSKARILQDPLPKLTSDSLWSVRDQPPAPVALDWLAISSSKPRASSLASSTASSQDSEFLFMGAASSSTVASSVASSITFDDAATKPARRVEATPAQWLAALETAISASRDAATPASRDQALDSSESPSSAYQLWSKRDDELADYAADDNSMWRPPSSPTNRYLMLTPTPGELDDTQLRASAETLRRTGKIHARPPPPVFHGSSVSAFTAGVSDTPRDFSAQALWTSDPVTAAAATASATIKEERAWLDKSLRRKISLVWSVAWD